MAYVVRFSEGDQEFELAVATLEGAQALFEFLKKANADGVSVWGPDGALVIGIEHPSEPGRAPE